MYTPFSRGTCLLGLGDVLLGHLSDIAQQVFQAGLQVAQHVQGSRARRRVETATLVHMLDL